MDKVILKETPRVIIWRDINTGRVNYRVKVTDPERVITAEI